jgi:hypothetical protein
MVDTRNIRKKRKEWGCHFGHLESNIMYLKRIRYHAKKCESPKFNNKQYLPYGTFLVGHEKTFRNAINLDIR